MWVEHLSQRDSARGRDDTVGKVGWKSYGWRNRWGDQDRAEESMYILSYLFVCFQETPFASEIFLCQRALTLSNPQSPDLFDNAPEICRHIVTFANFLAISPWQGVPSLLYSPRIRLFAHLSLPASIGWLTLSFHVHSFVHRYAMVTSTQSHEKSCRSFGFCPNEGEGEPCPNFLAPLFISAFLVNKRSLFPPKRQ